MNEETFSCSQGTAAASEPAAGHVGQGGAEQGKPVQWGLECR